MSRIHEALKKAQQERANATGATSPLEGATPPPLDAPAVPTSLSPSGAPAIGQAPQATPSLVALLAGRPVKPWRPNLNTMLFFNGHRNTAGLEEFRTLRSRLYQIRDKQPLKSLVVTSALPGEGKTFVAANLAQAIVRQHDRRVLLIDGDLRRPQLHLAFGAAEAPGLSDYLLGQADEVSIVQRSPMNNLFFIARGQEISNPSELLANGRLAILIGHLAPAFDWIILDSPAAIPVSDASLLANACDALLMVVLAASTPFDVAQKVRQDFADKSVIGVVLNKIDPREGYAAYYSYYAYDRHAPEGKEE